MMPFHLFATVNSFGYQGVPIDEYGDTTLSFEVSMREPAKNKDKLKALLGDCQARVSISMSEKISGPHYSSVSVNATVTLTCDQSEKAVTEAQEFALGECMTFIDTHLLDVHGVLMQAVDDALKRERDRNDRES